MALNTTVQDKSTSVQSYMNIPDLGKPKPDMTAANLIEGAGSLFTETVKAVDKNNIEQAGKSFQEGYDKVNDRFGVSDAAMDSRLGLPVKGAVLQDDQYTSTSADPNEIAQQPESDSTDFSSQNRALPSGASVPLDKAARLQRAMEANRISPSEYNAAMEAEVRRVRAEYPGYRDQIDAKVREITGMTPANALRRSLMQDQIANQRAANSQETYQRNFKDKNGKYVTSADMDLPFDQFRDKVLREQQREHQFAVSSQALANDAAKGTNVTTRATQVVTAGSTADADKIVQSFITPEIQKRIDSQKPFTNQEIEGLRPAIGQLRLKLADSFEKWMDRPSDYDPAHPEYKGSGPTFRTLINDPNKVGAMKREYLARADDIETRFKDESFGIINFDKNSANASVQAADAGLMRKGQMATLAVVNQRFGPAVANLVLAPSEGPGGEKLSVLPVVQRSILEAGKLSSVTPDGDTPGATAQKAEIEARKTGAQPMTKEFYIAHLASIKATITNPSLPDEARVNAIRNTIKDPAYVTTSYRAGSSQATAYATLTSPEVTDSVRKLSVTDPKLWQDYRKYVGTQFVAINKASVDDLAKVAEVPGYKVVFNPEGNRFDIQPEKGRGPVEDSARAENAKVYQSKLDVLNRAIQPLAYALRQDKEEVGPEILRMTQAMGVDLNAPKVGFWDGVTKAVTSTVSSASSRVKDAFKDLYVPPEDMNDDGSPKPGK